MGEAQPAMSFIHAAIGSDSMHDFYMSKSQAWSEALHDAINQSEGVCRMKALGFLGQLCKAEWQAAPSHEFEPTSYCHNALCKKTFRCFTVAFRGAVQVSCTSQLFLHCLHIHCSIDVVSSCGWLFENGLANTLYLKA